VPGRPATGTLQPSLHPGQPPRPILPTKAQPGALQPATPIRPQAPQPILPQRATPAAVQPHAGDAFPLPVNFTLKPRGSGQLLPEPVQKKMEAFFNTSFADVRIHVGPEAPSIGALAFTHGTDLYFAPGQYNPQSSQGQQLLGHELTHVVQQRAGRVRNPLGSGAAVVQDPALEAEADRMGHRAAAHRVEVQAKMAPSPVQPSSPVRISAPMSAGPGSYRLVAGTGGRQVGSVMVHTKDRASVEVTDLGVDQAHRQHGIGEMLIASAARAGQQSGKSKMTLAAQDQGSGRLTQWYKRIGFAQVGVNQSGYPQLEAPISRVLAEVAQKRERQYVKPDPATPGGKDGVRGVGTASWTGDPRGRGSTGKPSRLHEAIQMMKRKMMEQEHDFIVPEQPGWYRAHVKRRIQHCANLTLRVWKYHAWAQGRAAYQPQLRRMGSGIAPTAEAQVGEGNYSATGGKLDAAHFMNTTIRSDVLAEGQHLTATQEEALRELFTASAATTMQLKSYNVGPDKVIDGCMTTFTQNCARLGDAGQPVRGARWAVDELGNLCLTKLTNSKKSQRWSYQEAIAGVREAMDASSVFDIQSDVDLWATKYQFE